MLCDCNDSILAFISNCLLALLTRRQMTLGRSVVFVMAEFVMPWPCTIVRVMSGGRVDNMLSVCQNYFGSLEVLLDSLAVDVCEYGICS